MQQILSANLWKIVRQQALQASHRKAAIAYVTRDLIGFQKGDLLIVNASAHTIASGETNASLLRSLQRKQVRLYHCADLHAKVLLLGEVAVIGSGNMSNSSADALVEAALMTNHASTVSGVASFIEQLAKQSEALTPSHIARLCKIKVIRRGGRGNPKGRQKRKTSLTRLGNRTWLVGVRELIRDPTPDEEKLIAGAMTSLRPRLSGADEEPDWVRWCGKSRFKQECREGDTLIRIWRSHRAKRPSNVLRAAPVLLKQSSQRWTRFYLPTAIGPHAKLSWRKFQRLLKSLGYTRRLSPRTTQLLDPDLADAIARRWKSSSRS